MPENDLTREELVKMSVDAGVAPLMLRFIPVVECESGSPFAYRTRTDIRSILLGTLPEETYTYVSDRRDLAADLLMHSIQHVITAAREFREAGRKVSFFTVRCPAALAGTADLYKLISEVIRKNPSFDPSQLCLEFPPEILSVDRERAHTAFSDMKLLKVRTAVTGCGTSDFPMAGLLAVSPDLAILDETATAYAGDRNKPQLFSSLVSYIRSMGAEVIAEGEESRRKELRRSDCIGFIDKENTGLSQEEAMTQKEFD